MGFTKRLLKESWILSIGVMSCRAINYLLTPILTRAFPVEGGQYAVITNVYAFTAILTVVLSLGMESTYFYFVGQTQDEERRKRIYSTILLFTGLFSMTVTFVVIPLFIEPIGTLTGTPEYKNCILALSVCVAFDTFHTIPAAYLRQHEKTGKYVSINILKTSLIVLLNCIYIYLLPMLEIYPHGMYGANGEYDVSYVFYINLFVSFIVTFFYWKELALANFRLDGKLLGAILKYGASLFVVQIAGIIIQNADKVLYLSLDVSVHSRQNLAIYGGVAKIAVVMSFINTIFRQAFNRLALNNAKKESNKDDMATTMRNYVVFMLMAFLGANAFMNVFRYIIPEDYWSGLFVVPILMGTQILTGIYENIVMGFKQVNKNKWIMCLAAVTSLLFFVLYVTFVPMYGYVACAWTGFVSFGIASVLSYVVGRRVTKISYPVLPLLCYVTVALVLFLCIVLINEHIDTPVAILLNLPFVLLFIAYFIKKDLPQYYSIIRNKIYGKDYRKHYHRG